MVVYESSIQYRGRSLVEKQYPASKNGNLMKEDLRDLLLSSLSDLASQIFQDDLQSITVGNYNIYRLSRSLAEIDKEIRTWKDGKDLDEALEATESQTKEKPKEMIFEEENDQIISIYTIADKKTDNKVILKCMNTALDQFLNRYSLFDIRNFNFKRFKEFEERLAHVFGDLVYSLEDRFQSIF